VQLTFGNQTDGDLVAEIELPPAAGKLLLHYWFLELGQDPDPEDDFLDVLVGWSGGSDELAHHERLATPGVWFRARVDLTPYAGETVTLRFHGHNGQFYPTVWFVDNVELEFCSALEAEFRLFLPLIVKAAGEP
jgi:hypothetical protein